MSMTIRAMILLAVLSVASPVQSAAPETPAAPPELGGVHWRRGFDFAVADAKKSNKPVLVLFQEVPGCHTCVSYGQNVLGHPLIIEAAETLFVPVAVYNNIDGPDKTTLASFQEKSWNNPVVRIISAERTALAPRLANDYSLAGLATTMAKALERRNQTAPAYLQLLADENDARRAGLERATFVMHCFWEGEAALGKLPATVSTMPGFVDKLEVVDVEFDPRVMSYESLVREAQKLDCASKVYTHNETQQRIAAQLVSDAAQPLDSTVKPDKMPKYYLANSAYRHVPMTVTQAARVNAALGLKGDADQFLSPRQLQILETVVSNPRAGWPLALGKPMIETWSPAWDRVRTTHNKTGS